MDIQRPDYHGCSKVIFAGDGGVQGMRAGEKADLAVAELGEMLNRGTDAGGVVKQDGGGFFVLQLEFSQDERDAVLRELIELVEYRFLFAEGEHGHTFDLTLDHAADAGGEHIGIAVGGAAEDLVFVRDGDLLEALDQLREERVGDVFDDDAEEAAAAGDERAGMGVRVVVKLLDGLPDPLAGTLPFGGAGR